MASFKCVLLFALSLLASSLAIPTADGGDEMIQNKKDVDVETAAMFAIDHINKLRAECKRDAVRYVDVEFGEEQVVKGEEYTLAVKARNDKIEALYKVKVVRGFDVYVNEETKLPRKEEVVSVEPHPCGEQERREEVDLHNSEGHSWEAKVHEMFDGKSHDELLQTRLGFIPESEEDLAASEVKLELTAEQRAAIPESFDWRRENSKCMAHGILDQGSCGSCYAFASATALSLRACIKSNGMLDMVLSPQDITSCFKNDGCNGGNMNTVFNQMKTDGKVVLECDGYNGKDAKGGNQCGSHCKDGKYFHEFKTSSRGGYTVGRASGFKNDAARLRSNAEEIQHEIMTNGPVTVSFNVHKKFYSYSKGVYTSPGGALDETHGWHAVVCIGWGVDKGTPYWIMQNSWGMEFGDDGYFKIKRGVNEANVELYGVNGADLDDYTECTAGKKTRQTGCWPGGCDSDEIETDSDRCWNLAYDEECTKSTGIICGQPPCTIPAKSRWSGCGKKCKSSEENTGRSSCSWGRKNYHCTTPCQ